ncbi:hypothetical protein D3C85_1763670 [compost metagenome]
MDVKQFADILRDTQRVDDFEVTHRTIFKSYDAITVFRSNGIMSTLVDDAKTTNDVE